MFFAQKLGCISNLTGEKHTMSTLAKSDSYVKYNFSICYFIIINFNSRAFLPVGIAPELKANTS